MSIIKSELDFSDSKVHMSHGSYRYLKVLPMTGIQTPTLSKTSPSLVSFELNPRVYNLSKSVLNFDLKFTAPGAATRANRFYLTGASIIDSLSIQTRNGTYLCQLNSGANNFFYSTCNPTKPSDKLFTTDIYQASTAGNTQTCEGFSREILNNSNISVSTAGVDYAALTVTAQARTLDITVQPAKFVTSALNSDMTVRCQFKFSDWIHTLFACDKNLFFNESLTVTVGFASTDRYCYDIKTDGTIAQVATTPLMSNLAIYLACEQDLGVIKSITSEVNGTGITMKVPYVYSLKTAGAANLTINQRLSSNLGQKLLKAYTSIVNSTESLGSAYSPATTTNVQYLRSAIDNIYYQDTQLDRKIGEWYLYQKDNIKGSQILSSDIYENWLTWCDNFTGSTTFSGSAADSYDDGLDIQQQEKLYSLNLVGDGAYIAYTHFVLQRTLLIKSGSIMIQ